MIVPSIDILNGRAVQLVGGRRLELDAGDPRPIAERFALAGEIAVVDLDAALGQGSNTRVIRELLEIAPCRVGGGIRTAEAAIEWLDAGAARVVLGTAAVPEVLERLPGERVVAALDAEEGEVVVEGWRKKTGRNVFERITELRGLVGGFLVTFVELEGRLGGTDLRMAEALREAAGSAQLTVAGGITTLKEIGALDRLGVDAQVGMALYTGRFELADALAAPLVSDRADGLWPTVVVDDRGMALGLAYSNLESLRTAIDSRRGVYWSRSRGLWVKGEESGAAQELIRVDADCDRDTLRFTVRQSEPGFCHRKSATCWGGRTGLAALERTIAGRRENAPGESYTGRLLSEPEFLKDKLTEEAAELADASGAAETAHEAADIFYLALVAMARSGVTLAEAERELDRRALRLTRRGGESKRKGGGRNG